MIKPLNAFACVASIAVPSIASAQTAPVATTVAVLGHSDATVLRSGTPVALKTDEVLTTLGKQLRVGQRFKLEVAEPVSINGQVVIPAGSPCEGEITEVRNKGMWGKSGHLTAQVLFVRVGDRQIRLSGHFDDKGTTGTAGVVGAIAFVPVAGFFMTGTSASVPVGAPVKAFLDEDVPVSFAAGSAPVPMVVSTPAAAAATAAPVDAKVTAVASKS